MNVIIAGGGVAGLSAAAVLRKLSFVKSILIFEPAVLTTLSPASDIGGNAANNHPHNNHHYNGIWSPALQCLESIGIYSETKKHFHAVRTSGYKDFAGRWLAQPTKGLQEPPNSPSLAFIENEQLLSALRRSVLTEGPGSCKVSILYGDRVTDVIRSSNSTSISVMDNMKNTHTADLLIAADGTFSTVFSKLYPNSKNKPHFRGYKVYRGYSEKYNDKIDNKNDKINNGNGSPASLDSNHDPNSVRTCDYGFQTWGPGSRFACVPTITGNAWYLAVTSKEESQNIENCGDYMKRKKIGVRGTDSIESIKENENANSYIGPFSNGSTIISKGDFDVLKASFSSWHDPIGELLGGTVCVGGSSGVRVSDAYSFNSISTVSEERSSGKIPPVVFIGDAAHTLDPILAQGAGVAIEDSSLLGRALSKHHRYKTYDSFTVMSYGDTHIDKDNSVDNSFERENHCVDLKKAFKEFEMSRAIRIRRLEFFSVISQLIGQVESPMLCKIRDLYIYAIPQMIKGIFFDVAIQAVSSFDYTRKGK